MFRLTLREALAIGGRTIADPQAYIADITGKIAADWSAARWEELMPWNWTQKPEKSVAQAA